MSKQKRMSNEFKLAVIDEVLHGGLSKEDARRKYSIKGKSAILKWMRKFGLAEQQAIAPPTVTMEPEKDKENAVLKARIKELERALEDAQLKATLYSKMIDIAERDLNIPIRKKPSTKQSGK